jgi:hypothetical protein
MSLSLEADPGERPPHPIPLPASGEREHSVAAPNAMALPACEERQEGDIRLARHPSTRKTSFLPGVLGDARSANPLAMKHIEARSDNGRSSDQRVGVRPIAEYGIAECDHPYELAIDE